MYIYISFTGTTRQLGAKCLTTIYVFVYVSGQTTRIILIFLAVTDLAVMFVEFFIHYVPYYWHWFPVFSSDISCGIAFMMQAAIITTSSWYLMLMTIERFTVVWFPMKVSD